MKQQRQKLDIDLPSITTLDIDHADEAFLIAGWTHPENPGHNARILLSPDGRYVARLAKNDPGFEAFADFCDTTKSPSLPDFHVNYHSDTGVHLTITDRLKRYGYDKNADAERQVKAVQDLIWGRSGDGTQLDPALTKALRQLLDAAGKAHARNPGIYEGLDFAADNSTANILFREKPNGSAQLVLTDAFARRGPPVPPDWGDLRRRLNEEPSGNRYKPSAKSDEKPKPSQPA